MFCLLSVCVHVCLHAHEGYLLRGHVLDEGYLLRVFILNESYLLSCYVLDEVTC